MSLNLNTENVIQIKNRFTEKVLKELDAADLRGANLRGADLEDADLRGANLEDADLRGADLRGANLRGANLVSADLEDADLEDADLRGANLRGADLRDANLRGANLDDADLRGANLPVFCKWAVSYKTDGRVKIGCKENSIEGWDAFFDGSEVFDTPRDSPDFKRIRAVYEAYKAYLDILNS